MFYKRYIVFCLALLACFKLSIGQEKPDVRVDQILVDDDSYSIYYTVYDDEVDSIEHFLEAYYIDQSTVKIPFILNEYSSKIKTDEEQRVIVSFNADSLAHYNVNLDYVIIKILAHKPTTETQIEDAINVVTADKLKQYMQEVEGVRNEIDNPAHYLEVQQYFTALSNGAEFENLSYDYTFGTRQGKNLIAAKPGVVESNNSLLITAHYDTVTDSPGADDNGSGFCGLLMAMEVLRDYDFMKTIKLVGFDDEEVGLVGSFDYVTKRIEETDSIEGVFNLEMIGYASSEPNTQELPLGFNLLFPEATLFVKENDFKGDFLICVGNTNSASLIAAYLKAASQYVPTFKVLSLETPGNSEFAQDLRRSDHAPFWDNGYKALMLTDGANFRNPNYHTRNDKSETLDFEFMSNSVKVTLAAVMETAKPIVINDANAAIRDAVVVDVDDFEDIDVYSINIFGMGNQQSIYYELPKVINKATLNIYNLNGQFLENIKLNSNKGRLNLSTNYNSTPFLFVVVEMEDELKYAQKIVVFP